jgi:hypothetical protein
MNWTGVLMIAGSTLAICFVLLHQLLFFPWHVRPLHRFLYPRLRLYRRWCWYRMVRGVRNTSQAMRSMARACDRTAKAFRSLAEVYDRDDVKVVK